MADKLTNSLVAKAKKENDLSPNPSGFGFTKQVKVDSLPVSGQEFDTLYYLPDGRAFRWSKEHKWERVLNDGQPSVKSKNGQAAPNTKVGTPATPAFARIINGDVAVNGRLVVNGKDVETDDTEEEIIKVVDTVNEGLVDGTINVIANGEGTASAPLVKLKVGETIYDVLDLDKLAGVEAGSAASLLGVDSSGNVIKSDVPVGSGYDSEVYVSTNNGVSYGDPITPLEWAAAIEDGNYAVGTIFKITKVFNGKTMRFIAIGLNHDVLSNTDAGELEPNGDKAKMTLQCYDMPFGKVNLGLPFEEKKEGNLRTSEDSDTSIEDCRQFNIDPVYPSNAHGYASAVGLRQAEQAFYDGLAPWLKALIKVVRKDIFISEIDDGDNYEKFDSTATFIVMEGDRYGSQVVCKVFSLSAAEVGIIPNPSNTPKDHFPYSVPYDDGEEVKNIMLEGHKYAYFNETYAYTSEPQNDKRRPRYWNNQLLYYWLRSPNLGDSSGWGGINGGGGVISGDGTSDDGGVAPAFCI